MTSEFDLKATGAMFAGLEQQLYCAPANESVLALVAGFRRRLSAVESRVLADMKEAGKTDRNNESASRATGASKAEARRAAARAAAVEKNRDLADALAEGTIGESQLDAIAMASDQTDGAGANSEELISQVTAAGPDKANAAARQWVDERKTQGEHDARYDRQRRLRKICRFTTLRHRCANGRRRYRIHRPLDALNLGPGRRSVQSRWGPGNISCQTSAKL